MSNSATTNDEWLKQLSSWDYHFERIRTNQELTETERDEILSGFQALREIMGDAWFEEVVRSRYPIFHRLINLIPWSQLSVARIGHQLQTLQGATNFHRLQKRLTSKDEYVSAEAELEVASYFGNAGFSVEFYPPVGSKEADLRIRIDEGEFYVEVTVLGDSEEARRASQTLDEFTWPFLAEPGIAMSGRVYKVLSTPHIRELKSRIADTIQKARSKQICLEVTEPGVLEFFIAPREKTGKLKSWQQQKGISGIGGPAIEVNEVKRIRKRLEEKSHQLPENKPGIIVVYGHSLTSQFFEPGFYEKLVNQLEETIYEHKNLILGAIVAYGSTFSPQVATAGNNYVLGHRQLYGPSREDVLIIKNRYSRFAINKAVVDALV